MRFETRLDDSDAVPERDGQLTLPDDLALMADQLRDDAARLAACYPPQLGGVREEVAKVASVSPRRRSVANSVLLASSLAGGLAALGLIGLVAWNLHDRRPRPGDATLAVDKISDRGESPGMNGPWLTDHPVRAESEFASVQPAHELVVPAKSDGIVPPLTPAVFQRGITGPEMEGWMDLREDLAMDIESIEF